MMSMNEDDQRTLLVMLAKIDQIEDDIKQLVESPSASPLNAVAEEFRKKLAEMRLAVESKLKTE
jgi:hypothetical protein